MFKKSTLVILALALTFGYGTYYMGKQIHAPVAPASVALPLGEQNRTESLIYTGYREVGEPYIVKYDMSLKTLPKSAWCHSSSWSESKLDLDCVWPTPNSATRFAAATVSIPLPSTEVYAWHFERTSLSAVPEMRSWLFVNTGYLFGVCVFALLTLLFGMFAWPVKKRSEEHTSELQSPC